MKGTCQMPRTIGCCISIILSLTVLSFSILFRPDVTLLGSIEALDIIEAKTLDVRFHLRGRKRPRDDIVIIAVDEKTEDELGRWQSRGRHWLAEMLDVLREGGAKTIGFDFTLAEPDEGSVADAVAAVTSRYRKLHPEDLSNHPDMLAYLRDLHTSYNYDGQLADAILRAGNVVLGFYHGFDRTGANHAAPERHDEGRRMLSRAAYTAIKFPPGSAPQPLYLPHAFSLEPNLATFTEAARSCGHFTIIPEADGYIRRVPLLVEYQGEYYPSLSLEVARAFKDKIVLVGFTGTIAQDVHSTPFQALTYPGVEVHATIIENILREDFLRRPGWTLFVDSGVIFVLGIVLGIFIPRQPRFSGAYTALISMAVVVGFTSLAFVIGRIWLNMTFPLLFIILDYLALTSYKYVVSVGSCRVRL